LFKFNDVVQEVRTGDIAVVEYCSANTTTCCIKFLKGDHFQIDKERLEVLFKKAYAICPNCKEHLGSHKMVLQRYYCNRCKEYYSKGEIREYKS